MEKHTKNTPRTWPRLFLEDFEQTGSALWFYLYILTRMDPKIGCFRGSFGRVAEEIGVSVVELRCWLEQLEEEEYLRDESLDGRMVVVVSLGPAPSGI